MSGDLSRVAVIVPTYFAPTDEGEWRLRVWAYLESRWRELGVQLIPSVDEQAETGTRPFSFARAANHGLRIALTQTDAEVFCIFGADHVPDRAVIEYAWQCLLADYGYAQSWVRLYDQIYYLNESQTCDIMQADQWSVGGIAQRAPMDGVLALDRWALNKARRYDDGEHIPDLRWFDESYEGWGYEDTEFVRHLTATLGPPCAPPSGRVLTELWHPSEHRDTSPANPNRQRFEGTTREVRRG